MIKLKCCLVISLTIFLSTPYICALGNSCRGVFEYRQDFNGDIYGQVKILPPESNIINLAVVFVVTQTVKDHGQIKVDMEEDEIIKSIQNNRQLRFKVFFPNDIQTTPFIKKILVNNREICNEHFSTKKLITTITLRETLSYNYINMTSPNTVSYSSNNESPDKFNNLNQNFQNNFQYQITPETLTNKNLVTQNFKYPTNTFECPIATSVNVLPLVFKGSEVSIENYPWAAAIYVTRNFRISYNCGGTLISNRHILTAGHCTQGIQFRKFTVILGRTDLSDCFSPGLVTKVQQIIIHDDFEQGTVDGDVAIMVLANSVQFTNSIRPVCIWSHDTRIQSLRNIRGSVAGWGQTELNEMSKTLRRTLLPVVSIEECRESNPAFVSLTSYRTFCAGTRNREGPCRGDSGAGFIVEINNAMYIRGIVSHSLQWNDTCDLTNYIVFVDVAQYTDWIVRNIVK